MASKFCVVYITAPKGASAKKIVQAILKGRLAACVNTIPLVQSSYWWKGKIDSSSESLLVIKTRKALVPRLINLIKKVHPYSVPEIIALPILSGNKPYLKWLHGETKA